MTTIIESLSTLTLFTATPVAQMWYFTFISEENRVLVVNSLVVCLRSYFESYACELVHGCLAA